jgi:hypothetical protein
MREATMSLASRIKKTLDNLTADSGGASHDL